MEAHVPYLPVLDVLDLSNAPYLMEEKAVRLFFTVAWDARPSLPVAVCDLVRGYRDLYPVAIRANFYKCRRMPGLEHYLSRAPVLSGKSDFTCGGLAASWCFSGYIPAGVPWQKGGVLSVGVCRG